MLAHQNLRATQQEIAAAASAVGAAAAERKSGGLFPLLELDRVPAPISSELLGAITALERSAPTGLAEAGRLVSQWGEAERLESIATWLDDPSLVDPRISFWIGVAAGPILEAAAAEASGVGRHEWTGAACPLCGGPSQVSVIAEESGEFMAGSPRSLVCSRCATWWAFARAVCPYCAEQDSRRIEGFSAEAWPWVRVDCCQTCRAYVKTFDLRVSGARDIIPLVDDVATLTLDLWAIEHGYGRTTVSLAGV